MGFVRGRSPLRFLTGFHAIMAGMTAVVVLYALLAAHVTDRITRQMAVVSAQDLGEMLASWSRGPMERREWASLNSLARLHSSNAGLRFVSFVVRDDDLPPGDKPLTSRAIQTVSSWDARDSLAAGLPEWAVIDVPIRDDAHQGEGGKRSALGRGYLGSVVLGIEPERAHMLINRAQYWIASGAALLGSLLLGLTVLFWHRFRRPVEQLAIQASQLLGKDSEQTGSGKEQCALTEVGHALGELAYELASHKAKLNDLHEQIEQQIQERTKALHELASRDPLTGMHNRRYFSQTLEERYEEACRYGNPLSLVVIDIDDFKHVNDKHGHTVGDEVLITLATALTTELRASDVAARFGGDEFIVLMPQTEARDARAVLERFNALFVDACRMNLDGLHVTLSMGVVSTVPRIGGSAELFAAADQAMYQAKRQGKNQICGEQCSQSPGASTIRSRL